MAYHRGVKPLSRRIAALEPSKTLAMSERAGKLKAEGKDVVSMTAGEPDYDTPSHIKRAAVDALEKGYTKYTPSSGIEPLRRAIAEKLRRDNGLSYDPAQVLVSTGSKHAIFNALQATINEGDEVLIPAPYWTSYPEMVKAAGGTPVAVTGDPERAWKVTPERLERAVTARASVVMLNSPNNPTGAVYHEAEVRAIAAFAATHDLWILSDEIYEKLIYSTTPHVSPAAFAAERTIVANGLSKSHCMTGWRMGYIAGPRDVVRAAANLQSQATSNPTSISQYAAVAALNGEQGFLRTLLEDYRRRRDQIVGRLRAIAGIRCDEPEGAFYAFPDVSAHYGKRVNGRVIGNSMEFCDALLDVVGLGAVPGAAFGEERSIRLSYAIKPAEIAAGLDRLEAFVAKMTR